MRWRPVAPASSKQHNLVEDSDSHQLQNYYTVIFKAKRGVKWQLNRSHTEDYPLNDWPASKRYTACKIGLKKPFHFYIVVSLHEGLDCSSAFHQHKCCWTFGNSSRPKFFHFIKENTTGRSWAAVFTAAVYACIRYAVRLIPDSRTDSNGDHCLIPVVMSQR